MAERVRVGQAKRVAQVKPTSIGAAELEMVVEGPLEEDRARGRKAPRKWAGQSEWRVLRGERGRSALLTRMAAEGSIMPSEQPHLRECLECLCFARREADCLDRVGEGNLGRQHGANRYFE